MDKVKIIHKSCGGQVGWYLGIKANVIARAEDFERMDGTKPDGNLPFNEVCPSCNKKIFGLTELKRIFD